MRREPFTVGSFVHVIKRGARGSNIVRDDHDRARFLKLLRYLNDANVPRNWEREVSARRPMPRYSRPEHWPEADPYVSVLCFCLMDNHFHLLLCERKDGGVSKFMQRLSASMASHFNARHGERGTLFQGAYRARTAQDDRHLQYLAAYIQVKNVFELHPAGLARASQRYADSFNWAMGYEYSSLRDYILNIDRGLIDLSLVRQVLPPAKEFERFAKDVILGRLEDERYARELE